MAKVGMREMLEAGAHFGHQTRRWNPKMRPFIFGPRNGIHIIDLQQTVGMFDKAYEFVANTVGKGGKILFVGTKKQAQEIMAEEASRSKQFYVNSRWLGGMLTNFKTVKQSVERMTKLETMATDGTFDRLPKKEVVGITRELAKLQKNLQGVKEMTKLPKVIFIIDPKKEAIAVLEARKLGIPIVATLDTNCDPDVIDYAIPANDDSIRSIKLFTARIADACVEGLARYEEELVARKARGEFEEPKADAKKAPKKRRGPTIEVIHGAPGLAATIEEDDSDDESEETAETTEAVEAKDSEAADEVTNA